MGVETEKYIRKPLYVDAVRVTADNFDEIVDWCQGEVQQDEVPGQGTGKKYIKVRVHNPKNPRQSKAFIGDWILYTERGYKVYTNKAFHASFDLVSEDQGVTTPPTPIEAVERREATVADMERLEQEQPENVDTVPEQEKVEPSAAEGKRVLSIAEQDDLTPDEVRAMVQSGEAVLAQDIAAA